MANHNLRASITYRRSRLPAPVARPLVSLFDHWPRGSIRALLSQAGPFKAVDPFRDAFRFRNARGWNTSEEDAATLRERFRRELDTVKLIGIQAVRNALGGVKVVVNPPLLPTYTMNLPDVVIDYVINEITGELTDLLLDKILAGDPNDYGRCGGMAFAALDLFLVGQDVPEESEQPSSGALRQYIWNRLIDSLDLNVTRFLEWTMQLHVLPAISSTASAAIGAAAGSIGGPVGAAIGALVAGGEDILSLGGADVLVERTRDNLTTLKEKLDANPAWPIGLIYGDRPLVWQQHQILALRYEDLVGGRMKLWVWDNNRGRQETTWTVVDPTGDALQVDGESSDVKGIICDEYERAIPPSS